MSWLIFRDLAAYVERSSHVLNRTPSVDISRLTRRSTYDVNLRDFVTFNYAGRFVNLHQLQDASHLEKGLMTSGPTRPRVSKVLIISFTLPPGPYRCCELSWGSREKLGACARAGDAI